MMSPLKLYGRDIDDMRVISACLQDAVGQIGDMAYLAAERRFVFLVNRYCWKMKKPACACVPPCKLAGSRLLPIKSSIDSAKMVWVSLLSVQFRPGEAPAGLMRLIFSGGGEIRLEVEACEAILEDISAPWAASSQPAHEDDKA